MASIDTFTVNTNIAYKDTEVILTWTTTDESEVALYVNESLYGTYNANDSVSLYITEHSTFYIVTSPSSLQSETIIVNFSYKDLIPVYNNGIKYLKSFISKNIVDFPTEEEINLASPNDVLALNSNKTKYILVDMSSGDITGTIGNIGNSGVGILKGLNSTVWELKKITPGSSKITVIDDTANNTIKINISEINIAHNNIGGRAASNSHPATAISFDQTQIENILSTVQIDSVQLALEQIINTLYSATVIEAIASEEITIGSFVNLFIESNTLKVRNANAENNYKADGFIKETILKNNKITIYRSGINDKLDNLVKDNIYYLSLSNGEITNNTTSLYNGTMLQYLGIALSNTELLFNPKPPIIII